MLVKKPFKKVKPHSSEESVDKVIEGEKNKYENDEYLYCLHTERAPARS